ncbi:hypothetical protein IMG5_107460 [Ichthyophthirius multifiliis]|uniref:Transmembrane protein n=1 Tax=Ichthyophthirius multifiliis TaxID=5932 RepID=G0QTE9_ICHMU|nr:hypothetical protein IMG5_107460 [Ichthyophthirius multifiliis]EGR31526.1 hypothetical protein IMG5_107460 [Ichthyophthirius multifiliis]|eukprot:XP_004035012.1 hypothetical protein IMG5_107460 [Ichthyophthirius multifiliis]
MLMLSIPILCISPLQNINIKQPIQYILLSFLVFFVLVFQSFYLTKSFVKKTKQKKQKIQKIFNRIFYSKHILVNIQVNCFNLQQAQYGLYFRVCSIITNYSTTQRFSCFLYLIQSLYTKYLKKLQQKTNLMIIYMDLLVAQAYIQDISIFNMLLYMNFSIQQYYFLLLLIMFKELHITQFMQLFINIINYINILLNQDYWKQLFVSININANQALVLLYYRKSQLHILLINSNLCFYDYINSWKFEIITFCQKK